MNQQCRNISLQAVISLLFVSFKLSFIITLLCHLLSFILILPYYENFHLVFLNNYSSLQTQTIK
jgi:hypothetical protein